MLLGEDPSSAADLIRSALGLGPDTPIENLTYTLEQAGVKVVATPVELSGRMAFSTWVGERTSEPLLVVSKVASGDRLRFSLAHELGHLVLHFGRGGARVRDVEREAGSFASALLLPAQAMRAELTTPVTLTSLAPLKKRWGVSLQALILRSRDLGIISLKRSRSLFRQLTALGYRIHEPDELAIPVEQPRLFRKMAELTFGVQIDVRRFAQELCLEPTMMSAILNAHATNAELRSVVASSPASRSKIVEFNPRRLSKVQRRGSSSGVTPGS